MLLIIFTNPADCVCVGNSWVLTVTLPERCNSTASGSTVEHTHRLVTLPGRCKSTGSTVGYTHMLRHEKESLNLTYIWSKNVFHSCDGNSQAGFFHDLIFEEVLELDGIVWFMIGTVCKRYHSC